MQNQVEKQIAELAATGISEKLQQEVLSLLKNGEALVIQKNVAVVLTHYYIWRREENRSIGCSDQVHVFYGNQKKMHGLDWRDEYGMAGSRRFDKVTLGMISAHLHRRSDMKRYMCVSVEAIRESSGSGWEHFFFNPEGGEK